MIQTFDLKFIQNVNIAHLYPTSTGQNCIRQIKPRKDKKKRHDKDFKHRSVLMLTFVVELDSRSLIHRQVQGEKIYMHCSNNDKFGYWTLSQILLETIR